jgi:diguanylate cyclase (GGDEF)-like protein
MLDLQRTTTTRLTPALMCLLAIATSLPIFAWHWYSFAGLLAQPGLERVARPAVLAGLNDLLLAVIAVDVALVAWLWSRWRRPDELPRLRVLVVLTQVTGYAGMGIVFGYLSSPHNTIFVSAVAVGLALLGRRPTLIGFVFALVVLTLCDWLVMAGLVPYAPALVPGTFVDGRPVAWWAAWQDWVYFSAMIFGVGLMIAVFAYLDRQRRLLETLSRTDGLTQLSNRRHFMERLAIEQHRRERYNLPYCLVICDADHFKSINDRYGHHAGDEVLKHIGRLLASGLRVPGDVAARLGGEEFGLLLTDCREAEAGRVCERLRAQLAAQEFDIEGRRIRATLSMGIVECCSGTIEQALKMADVNLYRAKSEGRDCVVSSVQEVSP